MDVHAPRLHVADRNEPRPLGSPIRTACPEDAVGLSPDGGTLYFYFTRGILQELPQEEIFHSSHGTWAARRGAGGAFEEPVFFDLGQLADASLDGAPSFAAGGDLVYFHSLRATNTCYLQDPPADDRHDIYVADLAGGVPGPWRNLGQPPNSAYPDGEPEIHPDGVSLDVAPSPPGGWEATTSGSPAVREMHGACPRPFPRPSTRR